MPRSKKFSARQDGKSEETYVFHSVVIMSYDIVDHWRVFSSGIFPPFSVVFVPHRPYCLSHLRT